MRAFSSTFPVLRRTPLRWRQLTLGLAVLTAAWIGLLGPFCPPAPALIPGLHRPEIIARAESGLGTDYTWGGESWTPNAGGKGPDCSGYVLKAWEVPRTLLYQEEDGVNADIDPRYTSQSFYKNWGPWTTLGSRSLLKEGDALARWDGDSGHVVLFHSWDAYGNPVIYEAPGSGLKVRRISRYLGGDYSPKTRDSLIGNSLLLDNPTAKSTGGSDVGGNWTRSTSNPGYYGDNYQVRAATSSTSWARWTPRLPAAGYYDIYLRWSDGWNRASNARVTINHSSGQSARYIDQRSGGGSWRFLGRYQLDGGYHTGSGSVTVHATGANGYVVADATLFVPVK